MTARVIQMSTPALLAFIKAHPKSSNADVAREFIVGTDVAAARTGLLFKQGRVTREVIGKTAAGVSKFGYTFKQSDTKKEREKTQENVRVAPVAVAARPMVEAEPAGQKDIAVQMSKPSINQSLHSLADAMADAILAQVKARLTVEIGGLLPDLPVTPMPTPAQLADRMSKPAALAKPAKKRALITGLMPVQCGEISKEFHDAFDLNFWNDRNGDSMMMLEVRAANADVVFLHTAHVSHTATDLVKLKARGKVVYVNGGLSQMKDALTKHYCEA